MKLNSFIFQGPYPNCNRSGVTTRWNDASHLLTRRLHWNFQHKWSADAGSTAGWQLTFNDDFNGSSVDTSKWSTLPRWQTGSVSLLAIGTMGLLGRRRRLRFTQHRLWGR